MNAGMRLKRADERGSLTVAPSLRATRYDSTEPLDSNDQDITGAWSRRGELGEWRMDAEWTRDTTLTSELEVSGLVQTRKRRLQRYLAPSFSYAVSPRSTLTVDAAYTAVAYGDAQFTGLVNYKYASTDLNWAYQWSEKTTVTGTIYGTRLKVAQLDSRTDTTGVQARLDSALSEIALLRILLMRLLAAAQCLRDLSIKQHIEMLMAFSGAGLMLASLVRFHHKHFSPGGSLLDLIADMDPDDL